MTAIRRWPAHWNRAFAFAAPGLRATPEAKRYHRLKLWLGGVCIAVEFGFFLALLGFGISAEFSRWASRLAGGNAWAEVALYLLAFGALNELVSYPAAHARGYWLERKFGLSRQSYGGWLADHAKSAALNAVFMIVLVEILYAFLRAGGDWWWVWTGLAFSLIFVGVARLAPVIIFPLFFKFTPLRDEELKARLERLAARADTQVAGIFEMDLSRKSRVVNAALAGFGKTRRIILADTLLRRFPNDEVEIVIAHELGHHLRKHLPKGMALQTAMIFLYLWLVEAVARRLAGPLGFESLADIGTLPLLALVGATLGVALMPLTNAVLRHFERQADAYAIEATGRPESFVSTMRRLGSLNMADPSPHPLVERLFSSHPSIQRRMNFAQGILDARQSPAARAAMRSGSAAPSA